MQVLAATRDPDYAIDGALCVPINALPKVAGLTTYTIIGGGKTAMDAGLWLLANDARSAEDSLGAAS